MTLTIPRMPDREQYGSSGNWPFDQLLLNESNHLKDLKTRDMPGRYVFGFRLPNWQRPACWTRSQQSAFLESCYRGYDVGSFLISSHESNRALDRLLLDGQQRLLAFRDYLAGEVPTCGAYWNDLHEEDQRKFRRTLLPFRVIEADRRSETDLIAVYTRLNFSGTPHTEHDRPVSTGPL